MPASTVKKGRTKYHDLCDDIRRIAGSAGPSAKLPTIQELCRSLNTTSATLGRALDDLETQNLVVRKNGVGIFVSPTLNYKNIAILFDYSKLQTMGVAPFWGILWGLFAEHTQLRSEEKDEHYAFHIVAPSPVDNLPLPQTLARMIDAGQVDGIIGIGLSPAAEHWIDKRPVAYVAYAGPGKVMVRVDFNRLIDLGVEALRDSGCSTVGYYYPCDPTADLKFHFDLLAHAQIACDRCGVQTSKRWTVDPDLDHPRLTALSKQEQGMLLGLELLHSDRRPEGILIADDMMTIGFLAALRQLELRPKRDIQIATHTNVGSSALFSYEKDLIIIEVDPHDIVTGAFSQLDSILNGRRPEMDHIHIAPKKRV